MSPRSRVNSKLWSVTARGARPADVRIERRVCPRRLVHRPCLRRDRPIPVVAGSVVRHRLGQSPRSAKLVPYLLASLAAVLIGLTALGVRWWIRKDCAPDQSSVSVTDAALVDLAYEQGKMAIAEQANALEKLRSRSAVFTTTVTGVVGVVGLVNDVPGGPRSWAIATLVLVVGVVTSGILVAFPVTMVFNIDSATLVSTSDWRSSMTAKEDLAYWMGVHRRKNEKRLKVLTWLFMVQLAAGGGATFSWLVFVWHAGPGSTG